MSLRTFRQRLETVGFPEALGGQTTLKKLYPHLTSAQILKELLKRDSYILHREAKPIPYGGNPTFVYALRELIGMDLLQCSEALAAANNGIKFLLVMVDCFSRYCWVRPLKDKKGKTVFRAFQSVLRSMGYARHIKKLHCDPGSEFRNRYFQKWCREHNVKLILYTALQHSPYAERVIKSLKTLIYKWVTVRGGFKGVLADLPAIVSTLNSRPHRSFNYELSPRDAEAPQNWAKVKFFRENINVRPFFQRPKTKPRFSKGHIVRVIKTRNVFHKGYRQRSDSSELFRIRSVQRRFPRTTYGLTDLNRNVEILGNFYPSELTRDLRPRDRHGRLR